MHRPVLSSLLLFLLSSLLLLSGQRLLTGAQAQNVCIIAGSLVFAQDVSTENCTVGQNVSLCSLRSSVLAETAARAAAVAGLLASVQNQQVLNGSTSWLNCNVSICGLNTQVTANTASIALWNLALAGEASARAGGDATLQAEIDLIGAQRVLNGSTSWLNCNVSICGLNTQVISNTASITLWNLALAGEAAARASGDATLQAEIDLIDGQHVLNGSTAWRPCNSSICGLQADLITEQLQRIAADVVLQGEIDVLSMFLPNGTGNATNPCNTSLCALKAAIEAINGSYVFQSCGATVCGLNTGLTNEIAARAAEDALLQAQLDALDAQQVLNGSTSWRPCNVSICGLSTSVGTLQSQVTALNAQQVLNGSTSWLPCNSSICGLSTSVGTLQSQVAALNAQQVLNGSTSWLPCNTSICNIQARLVVVEAEVAAINGTGNLNGTQNVYPCNTTICGINTQVIANTPTISTVSVDFSGPWSGFVTISCQFVRMPHFRSLLCPSLSGTANNGNFFISGNSASWTSADAPSPIEAQLTYSAVLSAGTTTWNGVWTVSGPAPIVPSINLYNGTVHPFNGAWSNTGASLEVIAGFALSWAVA